MTLETTETHSVATSSWNFPETTVVTKLEQFNELSHHQTQPVLISPANSTTDADNYGSGGNYCTIESSMERKKDLEIELKIAHSNEKEALDALLNMAKGVRTISSQMKRVSVPLLHEDKGRINESLPELPSSLSSSPSKLSPSLSSLSSLSPSLSSVGGRATAATICNNDYDSNQHPIIPELLAGTLFGTDLFELWDASRTLQDRVRLASEEAALAVEDVRAAQKAAKVALARARETSDLAETYRKENMKYEKENLKLRIKVDRLCSEKRVLIKEVKSLRKQRATSKKQEVCHLLEQHVVGALLLHEKQLQAGGKGHFNVRIEKENTNQAAEKELEKIDNEGKNLEDMVIVNEDVLETSGKVSSKSSDDSKEQRLATSKCLTKLDPEIDSRIDSKIVNDDSQDASKEMTLEKKSSSHLEQDLSIAKCFKMMDPFSDFRIETDVVNDDSKDSSKEMTLEKKSEQTAIDQGVVKESTITSAAKESTTTETISRRERTKTPLGFGSNVAVGFGRFNAGWKKHKDGDGSCGKISMPKGKVKAAFKDKINNKENIIGGGSNKQKETGNGRSSSIPFKATNNSKELTRSIDTKVEDDPDETTCDNCCDKKQYFPVKLAAKNNGRLTPATQETSSESISSCSLTPATSNTSSTVEGDLGSRMKRFFHLSGPSTQRNITTFTKPPLLTLPMEETETVSPLPSLQEECSIVSSSSESNVTNEKSTLPQDGKRQEDVDNTNSNFQFPTMISSMPRNVSFSSEQDSIPSSLATPSLLTPSDSPTGYILHKELESYQDKIFRSLAIPNDEEMNETYFESVTNTTTASSSYQQHQNPTQLSTKPCI